MDCNKDTTKSGYLTFETGSLYTINWRPIGGSGSKTRTLRRDNSVPDPRKYSNTFVTTSDQDSDPSKAPRDKTNKSTKVILYVLQ